jgi:hypothetical protein
MSLSPKNYIEANVESILFYTVGTNLCIRRLTYTEGVAAVIHDPFDFMNIRSKLTGNTGDTVTLFMQSFLFITI